MKNKISLLFALLIIFQTADAQFQISGKLRTLRPVTLSLRNLNDSLVWSVDISNSREFASGKINIKEDLYKLKIGDFESFIILENRPISIKGFLDDKNISNTDLFFDGQQLCLSFKSAELEFLKGDSKGWSFNAIKDKYPGIVLASIIYVYNNFFNTKIESVKEAVLKNSGHDSNPLVIKHLLEKNEKMSVFALGADLIDFSLPDSSGKLHHTSDFKGKIILLDFWASWCGPCRVEMKSLQKIHEEIKGDDLIFISISLDDDRSKWIKALETDNIPWLALWDEDGFDNSEFRTQFGFNQIPFIALIDANGRLIARNLRGEDVKSEILKLRNNK